MSICRVISYPYSGTKVMTAFLSFLAQCWTTRIQNLSKNSLTSEKTGSSGSGHCEDCVVPMRAWMWWTWLVWIPEGKHVVTRVFTWGIIRSRISLSSSPWSRNLSQHTTQWEMSVVIRSLGTVSIGMRKDMGDLLWDLAQDIVGRIRVEQRTITMRLLTNPSSKTFLLVNL